MKTSRLLLLPLAALALAGCSKQPAPGDEPKTGGPALSERVENAYEKTKDAAVEAKDTVAAKLAEWKLTPADIKADLEKTGRVVREKTLAAGEKAGGAVDNARIVTVINAKLVADKDLSALKINVDAADGVVTLRGTVASAELVGRAIALALDTDGVSRVVSLLAHESAPTEETKAPGMM